MISEWLTTGARAEPRADDVRGLRALIEPCRAYVSATTSEASRIRTMTHGMANVAGMGSADVEPLHPSFDGDCLGSDGAVHSRAHHVPGVSGRHPDEPEPVRGSP